MNVPQHIQIADAVTDQLPTWLQYLQILSTPIIALAALSVTGYFAWRQWRTAHEQWKIARQRVVLDLFDKRMEAYEGLRLVASHVLQKGATDLDVYTKFRRASDRIPFLFGPNVQAYVLKMDESLREHCLACTATTGDQGETNQGLLKIKHREYLEIIKFFDEFPKLIAPYVQMHTKVP